MSILKILFCVFILFFLFKYKNKNCHLSLIENALCNSSLFLHFVPPIWWNSWFLQEPNKQILKITTWMHLKVHNISFYNVNTYLECHCFLWQAKSQRKISLCSLRCRMSTQPVDSSCSSLICWECSLDASFSLVMTFRRCKWLHMLSECSCALGLCLC